MRIIVIDNPDAAAIELILKSGFHVYVEGSIPEVAEVPKVESKPGGRYGRGHFRLFSFFPTHRQKKDPFLG
jgi:hypothetical protein